MTPDDFLRAGELFDRLREAGDEEREQALAEACAENPKLRREVTRLLDADRKAESSAFLARRATEDAAGLIASLEDEDAPPALTPGTRLGPYEIVNRFGRGGMGEVYRAHDTQLNRDVAIKVLKPALANDAKYMERFRYEAKILASLNHPNIATIYGVEQGALVMEFVEGENLRGPVPVAEAIPIARQMAVALEAAHERGIVHRDLKPGNIRITPAGEVKLLDFGLAKSAALPAMDPSTTPTSSSGGSPMLTVAGTVMGSAAYMAPEQAKGKPADKRADIWAFGVVFYELLTGERLFAGETIAETLAAIVRDTPDLSKLPPETPVYVGRLLERCLRKDARSRLRDIGEARVALDEPMEEPRAGPRRKWPVAVAGGMMVLAAALGWFWPRASIRDTRSLRLAVLPPEHAGFSLVSLPALSPDGRYLAFATGSGREAHLWVRDLTAAQSREIPAAEGAFDPFWSADSRSIGFFVPGKLKRVSVDAGPLTAICDAADGRGGTWNRDGVIVFAPSYGGPLYRVSADGGTPQVLGELQEAEGETSHAFPWFLPDGAHYLYTSRNADPAKNAVFVGDLRSKERARVVQVSSNAVYAPPGYLLYQRAGTLMAQGFDAGRFRVKGEPVAVAEQAGFLPGNLQGQFTVSQTGLLSYYSGSNPLLSQLTWVDRQGKILETTGEPEVMQAPALSPDGTTVAVDRLDPAIGTYDLWLYDLAKHTVSRFTFDSGNDIFPVWSRDGKTILFSSDRRGNLSLYRKEASGAHPEQRLLEMGGITLPTDEGGGFLLFSNQGPGAENNLFELPLTPGAKPVPLARSKGSQSHGRLSPDGRWLAYDSDETGSLQVFVATFPQAQGKWQVSEGGSRPVWSRDGRELFYVAASGKVMRMTVEAGGLFAHGQPEAMFQTRMPPMSPFEVSRDGKRFLILNGTEPDVSTPLSLVVNWAGGLK